MAFYLFRLFVQQITQQNHRKQDITNNQGDMDMAAVA